MGRLDGKVAVITGGAGGLGAAAARLFLQEGAKVALIDRAEALPERLAAQIGGPEVIGIAADVRDAEEVEAYTRAVVERFGGLDIALLNAGITGPNTPLETYPVDAFDEVMSINIRGVWLGLRAAIGPMKRRGSGSIVITSSIQGLSAMPDTSGYTTSKHAVVGMAKGAALELATHNIRVNAINPGYSDTPMMQRIHESAAPDAPDAMRDAIAATVPMRRYGAPEEIARLMLFLASDESSYCTGACFPADGGILASWTSPPG